MAASAAVAPPAAVLTPSPIATSLSAFSNQMRRHGTGGIGQNPNDNFLNNSNITFILRQKPPINYLISDHLVIIIYEYACAEFAIVRWAQIPLLFGSPAFSLLSTSCIDQLKRSHQFSLDSFYWVKRHIKTNSQPPYFDGNSTNKGNNTENALR